MELEVESNRFIIDAVRFKVEIHFIRLYSDMKIDWLKSVVVCRII